MQKGLPVHAKGTQKHTQGGPGSVVNVKKIVHHELHEAQLCQMN